MAGTFPTGSESGTTLASYIPAVWGDKINEFYRVKLVLGSFFTDRSSELAQGGNILYTPTTTEMVAAAKANATAVTVNNPTDAKVTLTVDQWYEVSFAIEDTQAAQVKHSYNLQERYAKNAAYTIAAKVDTAIGALFATFTNSVGTSTTAIVDSDIRKSLGILEAIGVDLQEAAFFFDNKVFWNEVMGLDRFVLNINTPEGDPQKRTVGYLYGVPVYRSNRIAYVTSTTGRSNALAHKDSIQQATSALGTGGSMGGMVGANGIRVQSNYVPQYLSTLTTVDIVYGVILNRATGGVTINTKEE